MSTTQRLSAPAARTSSPPASGVGTSLGIFGLGAALMLLGTQLFIPALRQATGLETLACWFLIAGLGVFAPLVGLGFWLLSRENALQQPGLWSARLRFRPLTGQDWRWTFGAIVVIGAASTGIMSLLQLLLGHVEHQPPFMAMQPLTPERYWLLALWLPYWVLNIMDEEFVWRGVLLPRQEQALGKHACLMNCAGWTLFHLAFGWQLLLVLLPILVVTPYVVQQRQNTWIGVIIHAVLNGPSFLAIAFGLI